MFVDFGSCDKQKDMFPPEQQQQTNNNTQANKQTTIAKTENILVLRI